MVSFADFMTLLFALFVVLFAISNVDEDKLEQVADSVQTAFGVMDHSGETLLPHPGGKVQPIPGVIPPKKKATQEDSKPSAAASKAQTQDKALAERLQQLVTQQAGLSASVALRQEARGVVLQLNDTLLFDSGSSALRPAARRELATLARELSRLKQPLRIEGHTDNVPVRGSGYTSNWDLSAARATSVLRFLLDATSLPPAGFSVAGYGEFRPIASNASATGRAKNRRVDIVILNDQAQAGEPDPTPESMAPTPLEDELQRKMKQRS
jgi:chemotaxis protein MotB